MNSFVTPKRRAWFWSALVCTGNAVAFWFLLGVVRSPTFFSFWNRSGGERLALTGLFIVLSARVLLWYTRRLTFYATRRKRSVTRLIPLAFGLAVFGMTLAWLLAISAAVPLMTLIGVIMGAGTVEWTAILLPLAYFVQFLFSQSTVIWFLAAGVSWPAVALWSRSRDMLLAYYQGREERPSPSLGFMKVWNVFGYLIFLLSLLFQSE